MNAFGDASEAAHATAVYFRVVPRKAGHLLTSIYMSNIRVAPVGKITLSRLELMGAVTNARLGTDINDTIDCTISRIVCGTNNSSTLYWFRGSASR